MYFDCILEKKTASGWMLRLHHDVPCRRCLPGYYRFLTHAHTRSFVIFVVCSFVFFLFDFLSFLRIDVDFSILLWYYICYQDIVFMRGFFRMNFLLQRTFENRGYPSDFFDSYFSGGHVLPEHIDTLCGRLSSYQKEQKLLVLLTDFDMDGIMCGVTGYAGFCELGFRVVLWLPDVRCYGFTASTIDEIVKMYPDVSGILTGDVGITCFDGVSYAKQLGLDVFVTDHHKPKASLPAADVIVDPYLGDQTDAFPNICGANVLYQVLRYYAEYFMIPSGHYVSQIERLRLFAGLGTMSDSMPLYHENRSMVQDSVLLARFLWGDGHGRMLSYLDGCPAYRLAFYGFYQVLRAFHRRKKFSDLESLNETFFAYYIAPCFNSIKRMEGNLSDAYDVFFGSGTVAERAVERLLSLTERRKRSVKKYLDEIVNTPQPWAPYVYITDAPSGLRGLLAQDLLSERGEPVFVVAQEGSEYAGSGRCPSWFPFLSCGFREDVPMQFQSWWAAGHPTAFGFGISDEAALDDFVVFLKQQISKLKPPEEELVFHPDYLISTFGDGDTDVDRSLFSEFLFELSHLHPFGSGFPEPEGRICFSRRDVESVFVMGSDFNHIKFQLTSGITVICFFQAELFSPDKYHKVSVSSLPGRIEVTGKLGYNVFRGRRTIQFVGSVTELSGTSSAALVTQDYLSLVDRLLSEYPRVEDECMESEDCEVAFDGC